MRSATRRKFSNMSTITMLSGEELKAAYFGPEAE